ncbi:hypothetical protein C2I18_16315 [Paenibacillus sp. PK3_47]|uniref:hypothetical protein n=1 Tax=Paenibacillus sp. PK3_47 TaxID=2072642 RepID=UPI00201E101D|nr:hypothetical protein [Paenibacillus sp. PK3_47]UQZ34946.1 hypothetical protein C2I18_16315 [Paenibacillus sp. PK3_47]
MRTRRIIIIACSAAIILYFSFCVWIARDTRLILRTAMDTRADYSRYMTDNVYDSINPVQRQMRASDYTYQPEHSSIGIPLPLHLFLYAKVYVTHQYDPADWGFREQVTLTLKLKKGRWIAAQASIQP